MDVAGLYILLPHYGMLGYFISFFISHAVNFALSLHRLLKISRVKLPLYRTVFMLGATLFSVHVAGMIPGVPERLIAYLLLLGASLQLFGIIGQQDLFWVRNLIHKK